MMDGSVRNLVGFCPPVHAPCWHVVQTIARQERKAQTFITGRLGLICWVPPYQSRKDHPLVALWPGYALVVLDENKPPPTKETNHGLLGLLRFGDSLATVSASVISALQQRMAEDGGVVKGPAFQKGQQIKVEGGPFDEFDGLFDGEAEERAFVFLDILGRTVRTTVPLASVRAV